MSTGSRRERPRRSPTPWLTLLAISSPCDCGRSVHSRRSLASAATRATFMPAIALSPAICTVGDDHGARHRAVRDQPVANDPVACGVRSTGRAASRPRARDAQTDPLQSAGCASLRLAKIVVVALKYGLDEFLTGHERFRAVRPLARALTFWRDTSAPRGGAAAPRAGGSRADLRQVRPDALDAARPAARPTSPTSSRSCRTACRRFRRSRCVATLTRALRQARRRGVPVVRPRRRSRARRSRRCISPSCRTARRSRSRCCGRTSRR